MACSTCDLKATQNSTVGATSQYVHVASSLPAFLAGSVAGVTGCVVGHPFDLLKVVQQTSDKNKSIVSAIRTATAKGPLGIFRGIGPALAAQVGTNALLFGGHNFVNSYCSTYQLGKSGNAAMSGFFVGILLSPLNALLEGYKCRAQVSLSSKDWEVQSRRTSWHSTTRGAFRGMTATAMRCSFGNAAYFGTYSIVEDSFGPFLGGAMAGVAFWLVGMPFDVIKSSVQTIPLGISSSDARLIPTARAIFSRRGFQGFYAGLPITLLRAVPMQAAVFYTYDKVLTWVR